MKALRQMALSDLAVVATLAKLLWEPSHVALAAFGLALAGYAVKQGLGAYLIRFAETEPPPAAMPEDAMAKLNFFERQLADHGSLLTQQGTVLDGLKSAVALRTAFKQG